MQVAARHINPGRSKSKGEGRSGGLDLGRFVMLDAYSYVCFCKFQGTTAVQTWRSTWGGVEGTRLKIQSGTPKIISQPRICGDPLTLRLSHTQS